MSGPILFEIVFDFTYLNIIYALVYLMFNKSDLVAPENRLTAKLLRYGFLLLAVGDTGHVGFRLLALMSGGLDYHSTFVGMGAVATAITLTLLYMIILEVWRVRFAHKKSILYYGLMMVGVARFIIMMFPQNEWGQHVPPYKWSLLRNVPLMVQGIVVGNFLLGDGMSNKDRFAIKLSMCIFVSYCFYTPVILFVHQYPMLGMLMVPKTVAYIFMAFYTYSHLYNFDSGTKIN